MSAEFRKTGIIAANNFSECSDTFTLRDFSAKYQQLEYLESTGTQWIDTGWLIPSKPWLTETSYYYKQKDTTDRSVAGIRELSCKMYNHYNNYYESFVSVPTSYYTHDEEVYLRFSTTTSTKSVFFSSASKGIYAGSSSYTPTSATGVNTLPLFGFRETNASTASWLFYGYIKYYKIYEDGKLVHYFIPAKRISDSVLGMYDGFDGSFHINAGSGTFVAGPVVSTQSQILCNSIMEI